MNQEYSHPWKGKDPYQDIKYAERQLGLHGEIPLWELRRTYESFNDIQLLLTEVTSSEKKTLVEVGCSTGELFRFISNFCVHLDYWGFDISEIAIESAKTKYPEGKFFTCEMDLSG